MGDNQLTQSHNDQKTTRSGIDNTNTVLGAHDEHQDVHAVLLEAAQAGSREQRLDRVSNQRTEKEPEWKTEFKKAADELDELHGLRGKSGQKVSDGKGGMVDAETRAVQLLESIEKRFQSALPGADKAAVGVDGKILTVTAQIEANNEMVQKLAHQTGMDKKPFLSPDDVKTAILNAPNEQTRKDLNYLGQAMQMQQQLAQQQADLMFTRQMPSVARVEYAKFRQEFFNDSVGAQELVRQAQMSPEALASAEVQRVKNQVDDSLRQKQNGVIESKDNPFAARDAAYQKMSQNPPDIKGAEADFKRSLELADKVDHTMIKQQLEALQKEAQRPEIANNPQEMQKVQALAQGWMSLEHASGFMKASYSDFLLQQKRYDEAAPLLMRLANEDPAVVQTLRDARGNPAFAGMLDLAMNGGKKDPLASAQGAGQQLDSFQKHLDEAQKKAKAGDNGGAEAEWRAAQQAAQNAVDQAKGMDKTQLAKDAKVVSDELNYQRSKPKDQQNADVIKNLEAMQAQYEAMAHLESSAKMALATTDAVLGDPGAARKLIGEVEQDDASFANRADMKERFDGLKEAVRDRHWYEKAWDWVKGKLGMIAAIGTGFVVGTVVAGLTIWSGPGAAVAGVAAGCAAGALVGGLVGSGVDYAVGNSKGFFDTFGRRALDGAGGGIGGSLKAAATVGAEVVAGEAAGSGALSINLGLRAVPAVLRPIAINGVAGMGASSFIRAGTTYDNFKAGKYEGAGNSAILKDYLGGVANDTVTAGMMGAPFKVALGMSAARNITNEVLTPGGTSDWRVFGLNVALGTMGDIATYGTGSLFSQAPGLRSVPTLRQMYDVGFAPMQGDSQRTGGRLPTNLFVPKNVEPGRIEDPGKDPGKPDK